MSDVLVGHDCLPFKDKDVDAATRIWLTELAAAVSASEHLVQLGEAGREDEPVVQCGVDGRWCCGRYVGAIRFKGRRLSILPRFGMETLGAWLSSALGLRLSDTSGELTSHEAFLPLLLAHIWGKALVSACRHGLPALRVDEHLHGSTVRGRIDVRRTIDQRQRGHDGVSSTMRSRSLDHAVSHAIVAAYATLRRALGPAALVGLLPEQARDVLSVLTSTLGFATHAPRDGELARVRFTPITLAYSPVVRLSVAIARYRGLFSETTPDGTASGLLLDMAELWELFVVASLRRAVPEVDVRHGTRDEQAQGMLLRNESGSQFGKLMPDALIRSEDLTVVVDAKYKSLRPTRAHPRGVEREDLYQMAAYLSAWGEKGGDGLLLYPRDREPAPPAVVTEGPWLYSDGNRLHFVALSTENDAAECELQRLLAPLLTSGDKRAERVDHHVERLNQAVDLPAGPPSE